MTRTKISTIKHFKYSIVLLFLTSMILTNANVIKQQIEDLSNNKQLNTDVTRLRNLINLSNLIDREENRLENLKKLFNLLQTELINEINANIVDDNGEHGVEKKSWKLPIKTIGWYAEKSSKSDAPQKMINELTELFDSFKSG